MRLDITRSSSFHLLPFVITLLLFPFLPLSGKGSDSLVINFLIAEDVPITTGNNVKLLKSGAEKFDDLFSAIKEAKHHIHLEYFNFRNDSIGGLLFDLLARKAAEGVEVRAIFDAFGNWSNNKPLKKKHLNSFRSNGIDIICFDPLRFPYLNHIFHRDHRKIVVIDGRIGYTGGMNVADYYIQGLPEIGDWRDLHARIEGDAVNRLQDIFLDIWNKSTKQDIKGEAYYHTPAKDNEEEEGVSMAIIDRMPRKLPKLMRQTYVKSIQAAKEKIQIVNPYFLPTPSIRKALKKAVKRGVEVEIMLSDKSDIGFTPDGSIYVAHKLMKKGAEVYLYTEGFHHSKIMMVDDSFCTIGSTNLDSRSLRFDYEVNAFIFNEEVTAELTEMFEADKEHSIPLNNETWKQRSRWKRFVGWFANLFTPIL